jgi:iron complex outermembrane receptor protein
MSRLQHRRLLLASASFAAALGGHTAAQAQAAVGEVVVTARRVEERLQDVPISITVVDQDRLTKANISSAQDLTKVVPGLSVDGRYASEQSTFAIRGFSQQLRTSAAVGTYFAEVVAPRGSGLVLQGGDGAGPGSLFDLQNVQVLKGPQGTLFGRNTTGGAVLLVPQRPTDHFEGYVEGTVGNFDMRRLQAVVNVPIAEQVRLRLGVDKQKRDGYAKNVSGIGPKDFYDVDYTALRASLVLDITPSIENYTIASHLQSKTNGSMPQIVRANPATAIGRLVAGQVARRIASGDDYQLEQKLINPKAMTRQFQIINRTTWIATDDLTVKNIISYSTFVQDSRFDIFGANTLTSPISYISTGSSFNLDGYHTSDQKNFTEELQFVGKAVDGRLNWQSGLYYEHSTPGGLTSSGAPSNGSVCLISGFSTFADTRCTSGTASPNNGRIEYINMAAYAQATYAITDQLKATAGVRYTWDRVRGWGQGFSAAYRPATPGQFVGPTITGCASGFPVATGCVFRGRTSDKKPTWTLNLQYNLTPDAMVYGTYSRGYKQGGVTPSNPGGVPFYGPEKLDTYELGAKLSFQGAVSGNFNVAGFYSKLQNQQILVGLQDTTGVLPNATSVLNAGKSRMYGVDVDSALRFGRLFRVDAAATYLETKIVSMSLPPFPGYNVQQFPPAGGPLNFAPKWSGTVAGTFIVPTPQELGKIEVSASYRLASRYLTGSATSRSDPVRQVDLNLDWRGVGGKPVDVAVFATNVTKQFMYTYVSSLFGTFGFDSGYIGQPRMYGVRVRARFGEGAWN